MSPRIVRDSDGRRYVMDTEGPDTSRVWSLETGTIRQVPTADLEPVDGQASLEAIAQSIEPTDDSSLDAAPNTAALGLLVELDRRGPMAVRAMLSEYDICESDLHGILGELTAAGLLEKDLVTGMRGYSLTDEARDAIEQTA